MELVAGEGDAEDYYWMVKNAVVPRPIAWISSVDAQGRGNLAPYSYFNLVGMRPPVLMVSLVGRKDTYDNIRATGEFVVNMVSEPQAEAMNSSAALVGTDVDEAELLGLATTASTLVAAPRLVCARVALECRYRQEVAVDDAVVVFAEVVAVHVDEDVLDESGRIHVPSYRPVGRLGGALYTTVTDQYRIPIPAVTDEWLAAQPGGSG
jgi:flavin reductase (DIM6/NTAB) family NADH-FMN oxidoreductase RutF